MSLVQDQSLALSLAEAVSKDGTARNLLEGVKMAHQMLEPKRSVATKRAKGSSRKKETAVAAPTTFAPDDYRNALAAASEAGDIKSVTGVQAHQYLREMGMTQSIDMALDQY